MNPTTKYPPSSPQGYQTADHDDEPLARFGYEAATVTDAQFKAMCRASAMRLIAIAHDSGIKGPVTFSADIDGKVVAVALLPEAKQTKGREVAYTACEKDLLQIIAAAPHRLTTPEILRELDRRDFIHGESTVAHALARLVKAGVLANRIRAPRGYSMAPKVTETEEER